MKSSHAILKDLINQWEAQKIDEVPLNSPIVLFSEDGSTIYVEDSWGPAIPYPSIDHGNGEINHGYRPVKGNNQEIALIPEIAGYPEYENFLVYINSSNSAIESVGCEKSFFPVSNHPTIKIKLGSYTDVIFSEVELNLEPKNILRLASVFMEALIGSSAWWSTGELGIQRLKSLYGYQKAWGLLVRVCGYGRTEEEAREHWAVSLGKLSQSIPKI